MEKVNWKEVAERIKRLSAQRNVVLVAPLVGDMGDDTVILNLTPPDEVRVHKERGGTEKWIRGVLWGWRNRRMSQRKGLVVWCLYDDHKEETLVGMGACVSRRVAERLKQRVPYATTLLNNVREAVYAS